MQRPQCQLISADNVSCYQNNILMAQTLVQQETTGQPLEKCVAFQTTQGGINTFDEFKNIFMLILKYIDWDWF